MARLNLINPKPYKPPTPNPKSSSIRMNTAEAPPLTLSFACSVCDVEARGFAASIAGIVGN